MSQPTKIDPVNTGAEYLMSEDGVISRKSAGAETVIGQYSGGVLTLKPEATKYRRWAAQWLTEKGIEVAEVSIEGSEGPKPSAPPEPSKHPRFGDKTPAYVEWLEKQDFEKFKAVYGILGPKNANGLYPATRKCHLTEKVESGVIDNKTLSWDSPVGLKEVDGK